MHVTTSANVGCFKTSIIILSRRFNDFNPPECTMLSPGTSPLTCAALLFKEACLCGRWVIFHFSKYSFNGEALPFTFYYGAARLSSLSLFAESEAKKPLCSVWKRKTKSLGL